MKIVILRQLWRNTARNSSVLIMYYIIDSTLHDGTFYCIQVERKIIWFRDQRTKKHGNKGTLEKW